MVARIKERKEMRCKFLVKCCDSISGKGSFEATNFDYGLQK